LGYCKTPSEKWRPGHKISCPLQLGNGRKFLWNLISGRKEWWKTILLKKYLAGDRLRCLDQQHSLSSGSPIGKLLSASIPLIQSQLTWIPGNGSKDPYWIK
jgi:hypothetical protein